MVIAIDGTCGSGKSTLATSLSKELGIVLYNTGKIYRTIALFFLNLKVKPNDERVSEILNDINLSVEFIDGDEKVLINNEYFSNEDLFSNRISTESSNYAKIPIIREKIRECQKKYANDNSVIMEGRDITSEVLPNADFKFFINCSYQSKLERRKVQLSEIGENISNDKLLNDMFNRDLADVERNISPLILVDGVYYIDTSNITVDQTIDKMLKIIRG